AGNELSRCSGQLAAARIADMGANVPYPDSLDFKQTFYDYPHDWSLALGPTDVGAQPAGYDPSGVQADQVPVTLSQPTPPLTDIAVTLTVLGGLLADPDVFPLDQVRVISNTTGASVLDANNAQLKLTENLTPAIFFATDAMQSTFTLAMDLDTLELQPLSSLGADLGAPITWSQIAASLLRGPRASCFPPLCMTTLVNAAYTGVDSFTVPVAVLRALAPANGYRLSVSWNATLPQTAGPSGRRLLSVPFAQSGVFSMSWTYEDGDAPASLGETSGATRVALAVSLGVAVAGGLFGGVAAASLAVIA
ncbi:MAG: hypothetical protein Q7V62_15375, partial [Actinomycetota bacterium]|nr:hypothetical protein [Actinomycetota bacterium]